MARTSSGGTTTSTTDRPRNRRGEGDRLRQQLVETAAECIAESGDASELTLRGVARRLGIAAPSIYRHFPDIEHLKMAVVEKTFSEMVEQRDTVRRVRDTPEASLQAGCEAYCRFAVRHPGPYRYMFSHQSPAQGRQSPTGAAFFSSLVASIRRCQENGATSAGEAPEKIAGRVWAALHGMILLRINTPNFDWQESLDDMTANVVAQLVGLDPNTSRHPEQEKPT